MKSKLVSKLPFVVCLILVFVFCFSACAKKDVYADEDDFKSYPEYWNSFNDSSDSGDVMIDFSDETTSKDELGDPNANFTDDDTGSDTNKNESSEEQTGDSNNSNNNTTDSSEDNTTGDDTTNENNSDKPTVDVPDNQGPFVGF